MRKLVREILVEKNSISYCPLAHYFAYEVQSQTSPDITMPLSDTSSDERLHPPVVLRIFSRVMTRPAGRVRRFPKTRWSSLVGSGVIRNVTGRVRSGRVRNFFISWAGSGHPLARSDPREEIGPVKGPEYSRRWNGFGALSVTLPRKMVACVH